MFTSLQHEFAEALFDPDRAAPKDISGRGASASEARFNVYRNNVTVSLLDALAARFSATQKIVGESFFKNMARLFMTQHPPSSPLMMFYGEDFPDFIASFEPAAAIPYLADVARLEAAQTRAYHAEDREPLDPAVLQTIMAEDLGYARFTLHPSLEIVSSPHPIVTIWAMNAGEEPLDEIGDWRAQDAAIVRPRLDLDTRLLPPGGALFLRSLGQGKSLAEAAGEAVTHHQDFDLAINLAGLFSAGLVVALSFCPPEDMRS
jgi:hypothetical protein